MSDAALEYFLKIFDEMSEEDKKKCLNDILFNGQAFIKITCDDIFKANHVPLNEVYKWSKNDSTSFNS